MRSFSHERIRRVGMTLETVDSKTHLFVIRPRDNNAGLDGDECRQVLREMVARWNAIDALDDLFAEPQRDEHDAVDASLRAEQIVRRAINGEG